jgi:hypothetical protein
MEMMESRKMWLLLFLVAYMLLALLVVKPGGGT